MYNVAHEDQFTITVSVSILLVLFADGFIQRKNNCLHGHKGAGRGLGIFHKDAYSLGCGHWCSNPQPFCCAINTKPLYIKGQTNICKEHFQYRY